MLESSDVRRLCGSNEQYGREVWRSLTQQVEFLRRDDNLVPTGDDLDRMNVSLYPRSYESLSGAWVTWRST